MSFADSSAARAAVDQNVLLGLLSLQFGCATQAQVADSLADWKRDQSQPFATILGRRCEWTAQRSAWLSNATTAMLRRHHNDAGQGLAMLSELGQLRTELSRTIDPDATLHRPSSDAAAETALTTGSALTNTAPAAARFEKQRLHASGGMGEVFVAVDRELDRQVALKEIKPEYANDVLARRRFRRESQITGALEHPGIVPVYGAGTQADGRPYYAMRLIGGVSLTEKIKAFHRGSRDFTSREFRQLVTQLMTVCNTVAYSHSREILHRDLKPSNVMVGEYGETLLVDWGLARSWQQPDEEDYEEPAVAEKSFEQSATQQGEVVGTLAYMSPEQATGRVRSFLPAADIYSLGATLYQLLTGRPPYQGADQQAIYQAVLAGKCSPPRAVCPAAPAALEGICLKAMAPQSSARYASAAELAADLESYLADEPVAAYREPLLVRGARWMKRHRTLVSSTVVAAILLIMATIGYAAVVANHNQQLSQKNVELSTAKSSLESSNTQLRAATAAATAAQKEAERKQKEAEEARAESDQVLAALKGCLRRPDPKLDGESVTVMQVMKLLEYDIDNSFRERPRVQVNLLNTIGETYRTVGKYPQSAEKHQQALDLAERSLGKDHDLTLHSMANLAHTYRLQDRVDDAIQLYERVLERFRVQPGPLPDNALVILGSLGNAHLRAERSDKAATVLKEARQLMTERFGADDPDTLHTANRLAYAYQLQHRYQEAIQLMEEVLQKRTEILGKEHPDTLSSMNDLAVAYVAVERFADGRKLYEDALFPTTARYGTEHPRTLALMYNLGKEYLRAGRVPEGIELLEPAAELMGQKIGMNHPDAQLFKVELGMAYIAGGMPEKGLPLVDNYLAYRRRRSDPKAMRYPALLIEISIDLVKFEQYEAAEKYLRSAAEILAEIAPQHLEVANANLLLGQCLRSQNRFDEAEPLLLAAEEFFRQEHENLPSGPRIVARACAQLVELYKAWEKPAEVEAWTVKLRDWNAKSPAEPR